MNKLHHFALNTFSLRNSTVKKNFFALSILQATNYIFPFITVPYISRIFGPEVYGLLNFATSVISYFSLLVNYGFDLSASRDIAYNRSNSLKINKIFNEVLFSKIFLFIISILFFLISISFVDKMNEYKLLYIIMFFGSSSNIFFPTWYFQGIEKLNLTAIFTFIIRFIFTLLIFVLIRQKSDYLLYPIATIFGQVIVSTISMLLVIKKYNISLYIPRFKDIINTLIEGKRIFFTTIVVNLYTTTNFVILGFLAGSYEVGIYTAAYKIVVIFRSIISIPLGQAVYPSIGYSFSKSYKLGISKIFKTLLVMIPLTLLPSFLMFLFPNIFIGLLFGKEFNSAILTLRILSFTPFLIGLSNIFSVQGLLNLKKDNYVNIITFIGAIIGLLLNFVLVPIYKHNGTAISWVLTEVFITLLSFLIFNRETNFVNYY
ncbi:flippase, partial [candidate division KSB1 bacterium]|nr:flippase [candidate division KSB1 bacterium]